MKIGIADPQARIRYSLHILLEQQPGWEVDGEAADCQDLLNLMSADPPDLLLIDCDLPGLQLESLLRLLRDQYPGVCIFLMSGRQELRQAALKAGADAFIYKAESAEKLLDSIRVFEGRKGLSPSAGGSE